MSDPGIVAAAIAAVTSAIVAFVTAHLTARTQRERLRTELKTQFMAEEAIRQLLQDERWGKRSFDQIKKRLGGFEDDDLRQLLVRAGAVRFYGQNRAELWGLRERNKADLGPE